MGASNSRVPYQLKQDAELPLCTATGRHKRPKGGGEARFLAVAKQPRVDVHVVQECSPDDASSIPPWLVEGECFKHITKAFKRTPQ